MTPKHPPYLKKQRSNITPKYPIHELSANCTATQQLEKTILSKADEKSVCEKYLNIYESLNQKESAEQNSTQRMGKSKIKMTKMKPKVIFENPVIQKSYTKLPINQNTGCNNQDNPNRNAQAETHQPASINSQLRKSSTPSKKNQMTLKLIGQTKKFFVQKQNHLPNEPYEMVISGMDLQHRKSLPFKFNTTQNSFHISRVFHKDSIECTQRKSQGFGSSFWQGNQFVGSSPIKAYGGYYKAKSKKIYEKQRQKLNRNSTAYVKTVDRSIQAEKERRLILRPKSIHSKKSILGKDLNASFKVQYLSQSYEHGKEQKIIRTQSQAKLQNFHANKPPQKQKTPQKTTNYFGIVRRSLANNTKEGVGFVFNGKLSMDFERKNSKLYNFNNRSLMPSKNYSTHTISTTFQTPIHNPIIQIKTVTHSTLESTSFPSPFTDSPTAHQSQYLQSIEQKFTTYPSKQITSKMLTASSRLLQSQVSLQKSPITRNYPKKSKQITLNKIQDAIENDTQLRIFHITTEHLRRSGDEKDELKRL